MPTEDYSRVKLQCSLALAVLGYRRRGEADGQACIRELSGKRLSGRLFFDAATTTAAQSLYSTILCSVSGFVRLGVVLRHRLRRSK
jgi:hypothetical protein